MLNKEYAVRAGYYIDPAPCGNSTLNIIFPSSTNHAITGGVSYFNRDLTVDFGMEYLVGMSRQIAPSGDNMPGTHKMDIFAFSLGGSYAFR
jgi:long-chain fatty acid transport protein